MALSDVLAEQIVSPENLAAALKHIENRRVYGAIGDKVAYHLAELLKIQLSLDTPPGPSCNCTCERKEVEAMPNAREVSESRDVLKLFLQVVAANHVSELWRKRLDILRKLLRARTSNRAD